MLAFRDSYKTSKGPKEKVTASKATIVHWEAVLGCIGCNMRVEIF